MVGLVAALICCAKSVSFRMKITVGGGDDGGGREGGEGRATESEDWAPGGSVGVGCMLAGAASSSTRSNTFIMEDIIEETATAAGHGVESGRVISEPTAMRLTRLQLF